MFSLPHRHLCFVLHVPVTGHGEWPHETLKSRTTHNFIIVRSTIRHWANASFRLGQWRTPYTTWASCNAISTIPFGESTIREMRLSYEVDMKLIGMLLLLRLRHSLLAMAVAWRAKLNRSANKSFLANYSAPMLQTATSLYCAQRVFAVCQNQIAAPSVGCRPFNLSHSKEKKLLWQTKDRAGSRLPPNNNFVESVDWLSQFQCGVCDACYPLLAILLKLLLCFIIIMYDDFISLQCTLCTLAKWNFSV